MASIFSQTSVETHTGMNTHARGCGGLRLEPKCPFTHCAGSFGSTSGSNGIPCFNSDQNKWIKFNVNQFCVGGTGHLIFR